MVSGGKEKRRVFGWLVWFGFVWLGWVGFVWLGWVGLIALLYFYKVLLDGKL